MVSGRYWPAGRRPAVTAPPIRCVPAALHAPGSPFCYGAGGDAGSGLSAACGGGECTARRPQRPPTEPRSGPAGLALPVCRPATVCQHRHSAEPPGPKATGRPMAVGAELCPTLGCPTASSSFQK